MLFVRVTPSKHCAQRGAALIVSLLILLVMSVLAVTSVTTTSMEEKMASNTRQERIAFEAAEAALRSAENWLAANITTQTQIRAIFNGSGGMYSEITGPVSAKASVFNVNDQNQWTTGNSVAVGDLTMISNANNSQVPRYVIEYIGRFDLRDRGGPLNYTTPDVRQFAFRITAIGWGLDTSAQYLLQSSYQMPL